MHRLLKTLALLGLLIVLSGAVAAAPSVASFANSPGLALIGQQGEEPVFQDLAKSGKKCWIGEANYFTWEFDRTPKMGLAILIIKLYDKGDRRVSDLLITGRSDMPSMRGGHDSGEVSFKNNKAGDYLLPVNVVMPGEWEIRLTFSRNGVVIFRGRIAFDV